MVFDKDKIKENFKIQPISWNYRISQGSQYFKKEREDFIISHKNPLPLKNDVLLESYHNYLDNLKDEEHSPYKDCYEYHRLHNMKTKKLDLKNVLKEFYIDNSAFEIYGESRLKNIDALTESKYFKGFFNRDDSKKKWSKALEMFIKLKG